MLRDSLPSVGLVLFLRPAPQIIRPGFVPPLGLHVLLRSARFQFVLLRCAADSKQKAFPSHAPLTPFSLQQVPSTSFVPLSFQLPASRLSLRSLPTGSSGLRRWLRPAFRSSLQGSLRCSFVAPLTGYARKVSGSPSSSVAPTSSPAGIATGSVSLRPCAIPSGPPALVSMRAPLVALALRLCHVFCFASFLSAKKRAKALPQAGGRPRAPPSSSRSRSPLPGLRARWRARTPLQKLRFTALFSGRFPSLAVGTWSPFPPPTLHFGFKKNLHFGSEII